MDLVRRTPKQSPPQTELAFRWIRVSPVSDRAVGGSQVLVSCLGEGGDGNRGEGLMWQ